MGETMYYEGSSTSVKKQGDLLQTSLYYAGTSYSGGLYYDFELAELSTKNVTALTV